MSEMVVSRQKRLGGRAGVRGTPWLGRLSERRSATLSGTLAGTNKNRLVS